MTTGKPVVEALLVLDVINDFEHDAGERLLASLLDRVDALETALGLRAARKDATSSMSTTRSAGGTAIGRRMSARLWPQGEARRCGEWRPKRATATSSRRRIRRSKARRSRVSWTSSASPASWSREPQPRCAWPRRRSRHASADSRSSVLRDACASVDPANERVALAYLEHVMGSVILSVEDWTVERGSRRSWA